HLRYRPARARNPVVHAGHDRRPRHGPGAAARARPFGGPRGAASRTPVAPAAMGTAAGFAGLPDRPADLALRRRRRTAARPHAAPGRLAPAASRSSRLGAMPPDSSRPSYRKAFAMSTELHRQPRIGLR